MWGIWASLGIGKVPCSWEGDLPGSTKNTFEECKTLCLASTTCDAFIYDHDIEHGNYFKKNWLLVFLKVMIHFVIF